MAKRFDPTKVKVTHILRDGTRLDSIKGYVVPASNPACQLLNSINQRILAGENPFQREDHT